MRISEQLEKMKSEKNVLDDKLQKEHALLTQVSQEKAALETEREILDEREFNLALKEVFEVIMRRLTLNANLRTHSDLKTSARYHMSANLIWH